MSNPLAAFHITSLESKTKDLSQNLTKLLGKEIGSRGVRKAKAF